MRAAAVCMCLQFFFTNTYCCFRCPSRFSVGVPICERLYLFVYFVLCSSTVHRCVYKMFRRRPSRIRVSLWGVVRPPQRNRRHIDHAGGRLSQRPRAGATFCVVYSALLYTHTHTYLVSHWSTLSLSRSLSPSVSECASPLEMPKTMRRVGGCVCIIYFVYIIYCWITLSYIYI